MRRNQSVRPSYGVIVYHAQANSWLFDLHRHPECPTEFDGGD
jgi:hypothetical protein